VRATQLALGRDYRGQRKDCSFLWGMRRMPPHAATAPLGWTATFRRPTASSTRPPFVSNIAFNHLAPQANAACITGILAHKAFKLQIINSLLLLIVFLFKS